MVEEYMERNFKTSAEQRARAKSYYELHKEELREPRILYSRQYRRDLKLEVLRQYGTVCYCCQEAIPDLLTIDHIENDGSSHRKKLFGLNGRAGYRFYLWLKANNWPTGFRTACFNCNQGRYINGGICPHQNQPAI